MCVVSIDLLAKLFKLQPISIDFQVTAKENNKIIPETVSEAITLEIKCYKPLPVKQLDCKQKGTDFQIAWES
jgi:hypothetical protein